MRTDGIESFFDECRFYQANWIFAQFNKAYNSYNSNEILLIELMSIVFSIDRCVYWIFDACHRNRIKKTWKFQRKWTTKMYCKNFFSTKQMVLAGFGFDFGLISPIVPRRGEILIGFTFTCDLFTSTAFNFIRKTFWIFYREVVEPFANWILQELLVGWVGGRLLLYILRVVWRLTKWRSSF